MAKELDIKWLTEQAGDSQTRKWIEKIINWRKQTLDTNCFIEDDTTFSLHLGKYFFEFDVASSFSVIELYQEIFKENNHFIVPGFSPKLFETVIDIGANQGFFLLKLKQYNPNCTILAVEPNPKEYNKLKRNLQVNEISGVHLVQKAVAASPGLMKFETIPQIGTIGGWNVKIPERPWIKEEFIHTIEVESITLDLLFEQYDLKRVDLLKMDVEGMELEILTNSNVVEKIEKLVVEYHDQKTRKLLIKNLKESGHRLVGEDCQTGAILW